MSTTGGIEADEPESAGPRPSGRGAGLGGAAVSLIAEATERTIGVAAAVAAGVADALALELEPATRLSTITVEASRNVVAHAYPGDGPGPLELRIASPPEEGRAGPRSLTVSVRDRGEGIALFPTPGDPPGLGLSMICALSDAIAIRSQPSRGMSLDATLSIGGEQEPAASSTAGPRGASMLTFGSLRILGAVLPRALAAHVRKPKLSLERLTETMVLGDVLARAIRSTAKHEAPDVRIAAEEGDAYVRLRIGPMPEDRGERLIARIGDEWGSRRPLLGLATEVGAGDGGQEFAFVDAALAAV